MKIQDDVWSQNNKKVEWRIDKYKEKFHYMGKRIAILIADSIYNRKGMMNAELNRITHLMRIATYGIDVFTFQTYNGWFVRKLRHQKKSERPKSIIIDGINIKIEWNKFSLIDYILTVKLKMRPIISRNWQYKYSSRFAGYDLIIANSTQMGDLARYIKQKYNIPYFVTWHGTDIHTAPFENKYKYEQAKRILLDAKLNFMVSESLRNTSKQIAPEASSMVLYNGVSSLFKRYPDSDRLRIRREKGVEGKKIVAFAGHLIEVKNPQLLPEIFNAVNQKYNAPIEFWVMGTGKKCSYVIDKCNDYCVPLKMWGNIPANEMPNMLNCVDVQVLPSRNEGLPLIAVEALACGANAVGARVGGIPEAMGEENTFVHGPQFIDEISNRIVFMLQNKVQQPLKPCFSWERTSEIENGIYLKMLKL